MEKLQIENLTKRYRNKVAVQEINLSLSTGIYGLLGANGAGKTTLMRMLCGILRPTSGRVCYRGMEIGKLGEEYRGLLGYLPQDFGFYPDFSAEEFLRYISALKGLTRWETTERTRSLLQQVGLADVAKKKIRTYSGGMKQRLGIAQAMLNDPQILILDEPTAGLDPKERVRFRNLIADYAKDRLILLSTHIVSDVEYIADEILMMKQGRLVEQGTVQELTASAQGKIWTVQVSDRDAEKMEQIYTVANLHHLENSDLVELRLITSDPPQNAKPAQPTLEDVYLSYFAEGVACD